MTDDLLLQLIDRANVIIDTTYTSSFYVRCVFVLFVFFMAFSVAACIKYLFGVNRSK